MYFVEQQGEVTWTVVGILLFNLGEGSFVDSTNSSFLSHTQADISTVLWAVFLIFNGTHVQIQQNLILGAYFGLS